MQKMDLDKNLKTHQINPLSYISEDDFWVDSHIKAGIGLGPWVLFVVRGV